MHQQLRSSYGPSAATPEGDLTGGESYLHQLREGYGPDLTFPVPDSSRIEGVTLHVDSSAEYACVDGQNELHVGSAVMSRLISEATAHTRSMPPIVGGEL